MFHVINSKGKVDISIGKSTIDIQELEFLYESFDPIFFIQPIAYSYDSFERNISELNNFINLASDPKNKLFNVVLNHIEALNTMAEFQQKVTNVLSSANTFLCLGEAKLKSKYGDSSKKLLAWNEFRRNQHGISVSYRLLYELRNYALHYGLPVSSIKLDLTDLASNDAKKKVKVKLLKSKLLNSGYKWKKIKSDIENLNEDANLIELIMEYQKIISKIYFNLLSIFTEEIDLCIKLLNDFYIKYEIPTQCTAQIVTNWNPGSDLSNLNCEYLPSNELIWILRKNV